MDNRKLGTLAAVVLIVGLVASCVVLGRRAYIEAANNTVEIVVDYSEVEQMAASAGRPTADVLRKLREAGAAGVAVQEQTIGDLIDTREMAPYGEKQFAVEEGLSRRVVPRLQAALAHGEQRVTVTPIPKSHTSYLTVSDDVPPVYHDSIPVGLPEEALVAAGEAGMEVIARLVNYPGPSSQAIASTFDYLKDLGIGKVVFQGDQVLGFRGGVGFTAAALRKSGVVFGRVEFAKQKGELELAAKAGDNLLIVHSIQQNEMPGLSASSIVERFQRAVRERGIRVCYVRMLETSSNDVVGANASYVRNITMAMAEAGFRTGIVRPIEKLRMPTAIKVAAASGIGAGIVLLLLSLFRLSAAGAWIWAAVAVLGCATLAAHGDTGRKIAALAAAVAFPTWAVLSVARHSPESPTAVSKPVLKALVRVLTAFAISAAGGVLIAGVLSETSYMLRNEQFAGVKAAHVVPILALAFVFGGGIGWVPDTWAQQKRKLAARFDEIASSPVLIWQAGLGIVLLTIVGVMIARSGNDPGVGVSATELRLRAILDKLLYVRPRTKEFLIGYPALLLGAAFALRGLRRAAAPLIVVGSIALVSEINTFCHIHTPLLLSGIRVVNGALIGCALGMVVYWFVKDMKQ